MEENQNQNNQQQQDNQQYQQQQPNTQYQQPYQPQPEVMTPEKLSNNQMIDSAFGKGLAATIIASFPIGSIIAIFLGINALKLVEQARSYALSYGFNPHGKNIAAKVLGMIGKILGIVMTVFWGVYLLIIVFVLVALIVGTSGSIY